MLRRPLANHRRAIRWHRTNRLPLIRESVFADHEGLQVVRVRTDTLVIRFPPWLPDLDEDLRERNDGQPPLLEVLDLDRAVRHLKGLGFDVGEIVEEAWEGLATVDIPKVGRFRLVGPWLPGRGDELERARHERRSES